MHMRRCLGTQGRQAAPVRTFASCSNVRFQFIMGNATVIESSPYGPAHPLPSWTPAPASVRPQ